MASLYEAMKADKLTCHYIIGVSIYTAGRLLSSVVYLFIRPVENNYDSYIDRVHAFFLSFFLFSVMSKDQPFFLIYTPQQKALFQ